ncbi:MAG: hypothetical protein LBC60_06535 [Spirochaetaceae bacterium]|jgi:hypothetical protein|nr:hypothetical protein [Spirochaetaceae bacterium]
MKIKQSDTLTVQVMGTLFFGVMFLVSCATNPKTTPIDESGDFAALAPGAAAYFSIDVSRSRPLLELISLGGFSGKDVTEFLDKTDSAVAAAYPPESGRSFLVAARGKYPSGRIGFSFAFSSAWKKRPSPAGNSYWRSDRNGLSVFLNSRRALVSDGDPLVPPPGVEAPTVLETLRRNALLSGWTDDGGASINRFLALLEIPLQIPAERILFGVYDAPGGKSGQEYEAHLRIETPSVSQAKGLLAIFSLTRIFMAGLTPEDEEDPLLLASALFTHVPTQEDAALLIRTGSLKPQGIALLFNMLSLYSNQ